MHFPYFLRSHSFVSFLKWCSWNSKKTSIFAELFKFDDLFNIYWFWVAICRNCYILQNVQIFAKKAENYCKMRPNNCSVFFSYWIFSKGGKKILKKTFLVEKKKKGFFYQILTPKHFPKSQKWNKGRNLPLKGKRKPLQTRNHIIFLRNKDETKILKLKTYTLCDWQKNVFSVGKNFCTNGDFSILHILTNV